MTDLINVDYREKIPNNVGLSEDRRVLKALEDLKLAETTLVIFSSDNGGVGGYIRDGLKKNSEITDNAPLRSGKGSLSFRRSWVTHRRPVLEGITLISSPR